MRLDRSESLAHDRVALAHKDMKISKTILIIVIYILVSVFNYGAINASHTYTLGCQDEWAVKWTIFFAAYPLGGTFIATYGTRFMEHGWTLHTGCLTSPPTVTP